MHAAITLAEADRTSLASSEQCNIGGVAEDGRYRLAAVRDARERDERGKRHGLAVAVDTAREAQARLDVARAGTQAARDALAKAIATRTAMAERAATPTPLAGAEQYVTRRRRELDAAVGEELRLEVAVDTQQSGVDVARRTLARARAERAVIDRHFAQWRETRRKQAERRED